MSFEDVQKIFGRRLASLRSAHNLRQQDVADALKCDRKTISHYERGNRQPDLERLVALADFFQCSIDYLLGRPIKAYDWQRRMSVGEEGFMLVAERDDLPIGKEQNDHHRHEKR